MRVPCRVLLLLLCAVAAAICAADEPARRVDIYGGLASLTLPPGWQEVPPTALEYFSIRTAEATGGRIAEVYQHGFRPGDPQAELSLPQVLVQIREDGRIPYGRLLHLPAPEEVVDPAGTALTDHGGSLLREVRLTGLSFDRNRYCLRVDSVLGLAIEGPVLVRSASFLTERGLLTLHCYEAEARAREVLPIFEAIIDSVQIDDSIAYRPRLTDRWSSAHAAAMLFVLAGLFAVVGVAAWLRARRRSAPPGTSLQ